MCLKLAQAGAEVVVCNRTADKAAALCAHEPARLRPAGFDPDTLRREAAGVRAAGQLHLPGYGGGGRAV